MKRLWIFKGYFKNIRRNMILNSYYTEKMKDGKSMKASFFRLDIYYHNSSIIFLITIFNSTKDILWAIILTTVLMLIYLFGLITWKNRTRIKKDRHNK